MFLTAVGGPPNFCELCNIDVAHVYHLSLMSHQDRGCNLYRSVIHHTLCVIKCVLKSPTSVNCSSQMCGILPVCAIRCVVSGPASVNYLSPCSRRFCLNIFVCLIYIPFQYEVWVGGIKYYGYITRSHFILTIFPSCNNYIFAIYINIL